MNCQPPHNESPEPPMGFEEHLLELQRVVEQLEEGQLGLDQALAAYERGVRLLQDCHRLLEKAERRIELLKGLDVDGQPRVTSFDEGSLSLDQKAARRGERRSHNPNDTAAKNRRSRNSQRDVDDSDRLF